jgi:hypothetical protein
MRRLPAWVVVAIFALAAMVVLIVVNVISVAMKPGDEAQIRQAIAEMRQASLESRPGGVQEYLSESFEMPEDVPPGSPFENARGRVGSFIRRARFEELEISDIRVEISGKAAVAFIHAKGSLSYPPVPAAFSFDIPDLQVDFRKETHTRIFVVPDPSWVVVKVSGITAADITQ